MPNPALELAEKCLEKHGFVKDPLWGELTTSSWLAFEIRVNVYELNYSEAEASCFFWRGDARLGNCDVYADECDTLEVYLERLRKHDCVRED